jgi:hypothetical protein
MLAMLFGLMSVALFGGHIYDLHLHRTAVLVRNDNGTKIDAYQSRA